MPTSLDYWEEKTGSFDKYLGRDLAYHRYLMDVSSLRNLPKSIVWTLCFPVCPLPFTPNHTHNTPLPAEAKGASGSQMGMFPDLIWT